MSSIQPRSSCFALAALILLAQTAHEPVAANSRAISADGENKVSAADGESHVESSKEATSDNDDSGHFALITYEYRGTGPVEEDPLKRCANERQLRCTSTGAVFIQNGCCIYEKGRVRDILLNETRDATADEEREVRAFLSEHTRAKSEKRSGKPNEQNAANAFGSFFKGFFDDDKDDGYHPKNLLKKLSIEHNCPLLPLGANELEAMKVPYSELNPEAKLFPIPCFCENCRKNVHDEGVLLVGNATERGGVSYNELRVK